MAVSPLTAIADYESSASQTVHSKAVGSTVPAGTFVAVFFICSSRTATMTVTDSQGNMWSTPTGGPFASPTGGNTTEANVAWTVLGGSGWSATDTITVTLNTAGGCDWIAGSLTGVNTSSPIDVAAAGASGSGTAWATSAFTPAAGSLAVGFGGIGGSGATLSSPGGGFSLYERVAGSSTNARAMVVLQQQITTGASVTASGTISASNPWCAVSMSFAPASSGTPYTASPADSGTDTDSPATRVGYLRSLTDTGTDTDAQSQTVRYVRLPADTGTDTDASSTLLARPATVADSGTSTDTAGTVAGYARTPGDTGSDTDAALTGLARPAAAADTGSSVDASSRVLSYIRTLGDTGTSVDAVSTSMSSSGAQHVADTGTSTDTADTAASLPRSIGDAGSSVDGVLLARGSAATLADTGTSLDAATGTLNAKAIPTPPSRILVVPAESRLYTVGAEPRVYTVPTETRVYPVESEPRVYTVESESRVYTVEAS